MMIVRSSGIVAEAVCHGAPGLLPMQSSGGRPLTTLVLSGHEPLRDRLRSVVVQRGGVCRAPTSVAAAWREVNAAHRLVFIDVARPLGGEIDEARAMAETLALGQGVLVAVCGRPSRDCEVPTGGDDEECWARQLGAFVYLPGVGGDAGVALLVDEARRIFRGRDGVSA